MYISVMLMCAIPLKTLRLSQAKSSLYNITESRVALSFRRGWSKINVLTPSSNVKDQKIQTDISLCVPLDGSDSKNLRILMDVFLPSFERQSALPLEVIIVASGMNESSAKALQLACTHLSSALHVRAIPQLATAAKNRNRCAQHVLGRVISFFDADDEMHSQRLEIMWNVFQTYHPKAILHGFSYVQSQEVLPAKFEVFSGAEISDQDSLQKLFHHKYAVSMGWITVDADVFKHVQQNETKVSGEDNQFIMNLIEFYGAHEDTLVYVGEPLGRYSNGWARPWEGGTQWRGSSKHQAKTNSHHKTKNAKTRKIIGPKPR